MIDVHEIVDIDKPESGINESGVSWKRGPEQNYDSQNPHDFRLANWAEFDEYTGHDGQYFDIPVVFHTFGMDSLDVELKLRGPGKVISRNTAELLDFTEYNGTKEAIIQRKKGYIEERVETGIKQLRQHAEREW